MKNNTLETLLELACKNRGIDAGDVLVNICNRNHMDANEIDSFDEMCEQLGVDFDTEPDLMDWLEYNEYMS